MKVLLLSLLMLTTTASAQDTPAPDHRPFTALLARYVTDGRVDYNAFAGDPSFARYLVHLEGIDPARLGRNVQLAYWINVYNAWTIQLINLRKERKSIRNINKILGFSRKSPWAERIVRTRDSVLTLDDVEHRIIRPVFGDPRIHVALVCAAKGCPPLRPEAYEAATLDAQLDAQAAAFLGQTTKNRVDVATRTVYGSPIFTWYRGDFGGSLAGVGAFWARYIPAGDARDLVRSGTFTWVDTPYDWSLNSR